MLIATSSTMWVSRSSWGGDGIRDSNCISIVVGGSDGIRDSNNILMLDKL